MKLLFFFENWFTPKNATSTLLYQQIHFLRYTSWEEKGERTNHLPMWDSVAIYPWIHWRAQGTKPSNSMAWIGTFRKRYVSEATVTKICRIGSRRDPPLRSTSRISSSLSLSNRWMRSLSIKKLGLFHLLYTKIYFRSSCTDSPLYGHS